VSFASSIDRFLHSQLTWIIGGWTAWLFSTGGRGDTAWPLLNYPSLVVAVWASTRYLCRKSGFTGGASRVVIASTVIVAIFVWGKLDAYHITTWERSEKNDGISGYDTLWYSRSGYPYYWSWSMWSKGHDWWHMEAEGPTDRFGYRHGKWRRYSSDGRPPETNRWYFHGDEVSAIQYRAMSQDD
jgi:hypothetical protein